MRDEDVPPTPERLAKGDLDLATSPSGQITHIQVKDDSILAKLIEREVLDESHGFEAKRYRSLKEAYELLFFARQRSRGATHDERAKSDDYLFLRKRLTVKQRDQIDFACFQPRDHPYAFLESNARLYQDAFDRLVELMQELDREHKRLREAQDKPPPPRLYARLVSPDQKLVIEIDVVWGQDRVRQLMAEGTLVHNRPFRLGATVYTFVCYDNPQDWARHCT